MFGKRNTFLAGILLLSLALIPACAPEETPDPADERDKFVDAWNCAENSSQAGASNYVLLISKSTTNTSEVLLENFYDLGNQHKARMSVSGNTLTIPQQTLNGSQISGSGTLSGNNTFTLSYSVNNGSTIDNCTATCTRQ
ncbi:MAG: hypothetical protein MUC87_02440 [Bacteroidia bacterium]|jgi:hypothetical protein|nr:hypothetical protein [Bacteroidia bacterium]